MAKEGAAPGIKPTGRSDNAAGGSAGIEIVGFPQMLYTRTFGDPDTLFVPLLEAARDANKMLTRLTGLSEERANAVTLSGMQLASSLLRGGQRSKPGLQMSDPLARLRHLRGGIRKQPGKKFHASKWIADLVRQDRGNFRQSAGATRALAL
jgi:hypothetical protein